MLFFGGNRLTKVPIVKAMVSSLVMYRYENLAKKKAECWRIDACFWVVVLGKTLENPLDCKEMQPVHSKGDQSWVFFGRNDAKAVTPILWPPHAKSWLIGKDSEAGRDWGAGGDGDHRGWDGWMASATQWTWVWVNSGSCWWKGYLACCSPRGLKESSPTAQFKSINSLALQKSRHCGIGGEIGTKINKTE